MDIETVVSLAGREKHARRMKESFQAEYLVRTRRNLRAQGWSPEAVARMTEQATRHVLAGESGPPPEGHVATYQYTNRRHLGYGIVARRFRRARA